MGKWTRRALITAGSLAGGGLLLGVGGFVFAPNRYKIGRRSGGGAFGLNTWVALDTTGAIRVIVPHAELGQGSQTALAMMLVDEMDGDWARVSVEEAPATPDFANGHLVSAFIPIPVLHASMQRGAEYLKFFAARRFGLQPTGGSASVRGTGQSGFRVAGAAARDMLVRAAAMRWKVDATSCTARDSRIRHAPSGREATYGELAAEAARLSPSVAPRLKTPADFRLIGTPQRRLDVPSKVDGSARYGIDAWFPGMLHAAVRATPVFGETLRKCHSVAAQGMPGVERVLEFPDAVAVVADSSERARRALAAVQCEFAADETRRQLTSDSLSAAMARALDTGVAAATLERGNPAEVLAAASGAKLEARYEVPFLAHATMEPMSATAQFRDDRVEIWTSVQDPLNAAHVVADDLGLEPERVTVHNGAVGGGFGRRLPGKHDYVLQAARIARAMTPRAVKLVWTREQDMAQGYYRPAVMADLSAGLDAEGRIATWQATMTGAGDGAFEPLYAIPNIKIGFAPVPHHIRIGAWRSVGHSQQGFFIESFIDELAAVAKQDPCQFRLALLAAQPRARGVLERVAAKADWGKPLPENRARGIAVVASFGSYVAQVADIEVQRAADGRPTGLTVRDVYVAVDCGILVNPLTAEAQVQGGVLMGLSAALGERISIAGGAVRETNFHEYPLLRIADAPRVHVEFLPSTEAPGGLGEPGLPPIAPAIANAWFAATGQRIRRLPLLATLAANNAA